MACAAALKDEHALEEQELMLRRRKEQLELDIEITTTAAKQAGGQEQYFIQAYQHHI